MEWELTKEWLFYKLQKLPFFVITKRVATLKWKKYIETEMVLCYSQVYSLGHFGVKFHRDRFCSFCVIEPQMVRQNQQPILYT